jgi:diacylglycerol O-acyltransferase
MEPDHYSRLSALDGSLIAFEDATAHMHVASVQIFDAKPLTLPQGGLDLERMEAFTLSRLHLIPRYRQRLMTSPISGELLWIDDDRFNIHYHLRHSRLPRPGTIRQLKRTAARILSQQLDRGRPLWEMWLIEGLEDDRFAVVSKVHHCMIDGVAGSELLATMLTPEPTSEIEEPPAWHPRRAPTRLALVVDQVNRLLRTPGRAAGWLLDVALDRDHAQHELAEGLRATGRVLSQALSPASNTPINQPIGPHRRFDWLSMDLEGIRAIKRKADASVNDVVLAIVAGAMRHYLHRCRQTRLEGLDFRVMAPVSVRRDENRKELGNHVSSWLVGLPLDEPDPLVRLRKLHETTSELKRTRQAAGAEMLTEAVAWTGGSLLSQGSRLMALGQPFNMVVTNVPGPQVPFYLLEARMLEVIPMVPLMGTLCVGVALFSYDGMLHWGVTGDWERVPDLHEIVLALDDAYDELRAACGLPRRSVGHEAQAPAQPPLHTLG